MRGCHYIKFSAKNTRRLRSTIGLTPVSSTSRVLACRFFSGGKGVRHLKMSHTTARDALHIGKLPMAANCDAREPIMSSTSHNNCQTKININQHISHIMQHNYHHRGLQQFCHRRGHHHQSSRCHRITIVRYQFWLKHCIGSISREIHTV